VLLRWTERDRPIVRRLARFNGRSDALFDRDVVTVDSSDDPREPYLSEVDDSSDVGASSSNCGVGTETVV